MFPRRQKCPFTKDGVLKEEHEQAAVVAFLREKYPDALFTIAPNGMKLPPSVAIRLSRTGYRAGTPDLCIYEPRGGFFGLFVEMKITRGGVVSKAQSEFIAALNARGYKAIICAGAGAARLCIAEYMEAKK